MTITGIVQRLSTATLLLLLTSACGKLLPRHGSAPIPQGQETHGGDRIASIFVAKGYRIYDHLTSPRTADRILSGEQLETLFHALKTTRVEPINGPLLASPGSVVNARTIDDPLSPGRKMVQLDRVEWETFFSRGDEVNRLVFHEYLWVIGVDDENYQVSNRLVLFDNPVGGIGSWDTMADFDAPQVDFRRRSIDVATDFAAGRLVVSSSPSTACRDIKVSTYAVADSTWRTASVPSDGQVGAGYAMKARGDDVFFWGGVCMRDDGVAANLATGIVFNAADGSWRPVPSEGAPSARRDALAIATPSGFFVWGGVENSGLAATGGIFESAANTWRPVQAADDMAPGDYRGTYVGTDSSSSLKGSVLVWESSRKACATTVAAYDLTADTWKTLVRASAPPYACDWQQAVWTGDRFIFLFQVAQQNFLGAAVGGVIWEPTADTWTPIAAASALNFRTGASLVWAGDRLLVFGGKDIDGLALNTGFAYFLETASFAPLRWEGAPFARSDHVAYWTGTSMLVWGGHLLSTPNVRSGALWHRD